MDMINDELFLRHHLRKWENRFVDGESCNIMALIRLKDAFQEKYGLEELQRIVREVSGEVAREQQHKDILFLKRNRVE